MNNGNPYSKTSLKAIKIKHRRNSLIKNSKTIIQTSEQINNFSCKEINQKKNVKDFSPILKNPSKHSVFQITHQKFLQKPMQNPQLNPFKLLLLRILFPNICFWGVSQLILFIQVYIEDYCFVPELCECANIFTYFYTFLKEMLYSYSMIMIISFYGAYFITGGFYQKYHFKNVYLTNFLLLLLALYGMDYENRKEPMLSLIKRRNVCCMIGLKSAYLLILAWAHQDFKPEFFKRLTLITLFELLLFFYSLFFKSYFIFYLLDFIEKFYEKDVSLNILKLFFLFFAEFYAILTRCFCYFFYKKIIMEDALSLNIVIFFMKMITIDTLSTKVLNILTSPLNEFYSWINFIFYAYYIYSVYSRTNFMMDFANFCLSFIFFFKKKKEKEEEDGKNAEMQNGFMNLMSNCILEANFFVFFRIITYKLKPNFIILTKDTILYQDCSLKESNGTFLIYDMNLVMLIVTHGILLLGIMLFIIKKQKGYFDIQVEDINFFARMFYFICFFSYSDTTLQIYKLFEHRV